MRKLGKILVLEEGLLNLYSDRRNGKLYLKVKELRKKTKWGAWKIAKFLDAWNHRGAINHWLFTSKKPKCIKEIEELKKMELLPLETNTLQFELFIKLLGFRYSDGCIYPQIRSNSFTFALYFGDLEDANKCCEEMEKIWKLTRRPHSSSNCYVVYLPASIARLAIYLSSPVGDKTSQTFELPKWIFELSKRGKWLFLDGLFSGDGSVPKLQPCGTCSRSLKLSLNCEEQYVRDFATQFMDDVRKLLNSLGVKTSTPKIEWKRKIISKDGKVTYPVNIRVLTQKENMIFFLENVPYSLCKRASLKVKEVLDALKGIALAEETKRFLLSNGRILLSKKICIKLEDKIQKELIEKAANAISKGRYRGKYKILAQFLHKKCNSVDICLSSLQDNYLPDWKNGKRFIPLLYLKEIAKLAGLELRNLIRYVKKVRLLKNRNKFAIPVDW